jgi:hypothetical protein
MEMGTSTQQIVEWSTPTTGIVQPVRISEVLAKDAYREMNLWLCLNPRSKQDIACAYVQYGQHRMKYSTALKIVEYLLKQRIWTMVGDQLQACACDAKTSMEPRRKQRVEDQKSEASSDKESNEGANDAPTPVASHLQDSF